MAVKRDLIINGNVFGSASGASGVSGVNSLNLALRGVNSRRSLFIQTQTTPNDSALKFLPSIKILENDQTLEFLSGREAYKSPLAMKLFAIDGIKAVMFGSDFITVEKSIEEDWSLLKPEIFAILTEFLNSGTPIFLEGHEQIEDPGFDEDDDEIVLMIKELIFTRIRPAIQDDGGDIDFVSFDEDSGTVFLKLRGACRSCSSSAVTLKNGIESMLKHYIEEVKNVEQIEEPPVENEAALMELEKQRLTNAAKLNREMADDVPPIL
ncbi:hypothetical protein PACTADRAFT_48859 [Pachysolen tannophilus NRRL Y-2460]|uniref:Scaffold protein Nfu/NifU N-terminal domain-containing protein n=1 Tax=Pachysolen tannophilus NRRL Y-2460 TaxID=669874 RepID=A0A1E4TZA0_PACTA|nr:hypothetical protein PACTADRAFT_48859 [Pachysolen tannophilus NRRL Y-2460]